MPLLQQQLLSLPPLLVTPPPAMAEARRLSVPAALQPERCLVVEAVLQLPAAASPGTLSTPDAAKVIPPRSRRPLNWCQDPNWRHPGRRLKLDGELEPIPGYSTPHQSGLRRPEVPSTIQDGLVINAQHGLVDGSAVRSLERTSDEHGSRVGGSHEPPYAKGVLLSGGR